MAVATTFARLQCYIHLKTSYSLSGAARPHQQTPRRCRLCGVLTRHVIAICTSAAILVLRVG